MSDSILESYIKPHILGSFHDAETILIAGSQGRALSGVCDETSKPRKRSDYDFVIIYPRLPDRFPAALFASAWMKIPGLDHPISIDMKIIDHDYLPFHTRHTREVRRFPFLFTMIKDGHPLIDRTHSFADLRKMAERVHAEGPALLGTQKIGEVRI